MVETAATATASEKKTPKTYTWGTGRRKTATARVRMRPGDGRILINSRPLEDYFPSVKDRNAVQSPLLDAAARDKYDVWANVRGGGLTGQAGAVRLGIARVLKVLDPQSEKKLREAGHLTRDARKKERKHYGRRGARRGFQFSKR